MLTAIGSDYCYELVFPTEPSRRASDEDMVLSITTSEHTPNLLSKRWSSATPYECRVWSPAGVLAVQPS